MFFQLFDSFLYISLAITFGLILLMVYHFKNRIHTLEEKNQDMSEICQMIIKELQDIKQIQTTMQVAPPPSHFRDPVISSPPPSSKHPHPHTHPPVSKMMETTGMDLMGGYHKIKVEDEALEDDGDLETEVLEYDDENEDDGESDSQGLEEVDEIDISVNNDDEEAIHLTEETEEWSSGLTTQEILNNVTHMDEDLYNQFTTLLTEELRQSGIQGISSVEILPGGSEKLVQINHIRENYQEESDQSDRVEEIGDEEKKEMRTVELEGVETEDIQVLKMPEEENISVITETDTNVKTNKKNPYSKMNVQMLRTTVISRGLMSDPSKVKKQGLVDMLLQHDKEESENKDVSMGRGDEFDTTE